MDIYIPPINFSNHNRQTLFIVTRPFYTQNGWVNDESVKKHWQVSNMFRYTSNIEEANALFIPCPINTYSRQELKGFNALCALQNIPGYGYISGDFGKQYPEFSNLTYFRMGGFKSQLNSKNRGFPVFLSDGYERIYNKSNMDVRPKGRKPVIGFCGHANASVPKYLKEKLTFTKENFKRFIEKPLRKDYEPLFSSAYQRAALLKPIENSLAVTANFIYRKRYRAGVATASERQKTNREYFDNILNSDYIVCVRGGGNFSVRLYETLMMGRIPIFVNTDCMLPFEDTIDWKKHTVWVEWKDRKNIAKITDEFHNALSDHEFEQLQISNRKLWKETLSVSNVLKMILTK
ncbi:MAG TPA: exostosin family protein [Aquaticitalea sp.]|nr:exostosin family protein [Aquaticitalea sp.]